MRASLAILAALAAIFFAPLPAAADCKWPRVTVVETILALNPSAALLARIEGWAAARFMAFLNAAPPTTAHRADTIVFFAKPGARTVLAVAFDTGCLSTTMELPRDQALAFVGAGA